MDELCPLCLKMGTNRKIKAIQLNLEEALWMCENEECPWPFFGPDEPMFIRRKVGEKWAYDWQTYRRVKECIGSIPVSIELSLYTPPVTPSGDASTKDSVPSETAKNISESSNNTDIFSRILSPRNSYAPRSVAEADLSSHVKADIAIEFNSSKIVPLQYEKDSKTVEEGPAALPSIFDIDSEFTTNKISIALGPDSRSPDLLARGGRDVENSEAAIDRVNAVLVTCPKSQTEKSPEIKQEIIDANEHGDSAVKGIPHIRSIAKTNIDLQRFNPVQIVKIEKPKSLDKLEYSATPPKRKTGEDIADRLFSSKQHTTTLTVDGIPPITLSYDLTDLEEKAEEIASVTRTPIPRKRNATLLQDNDHDNELSAEIPKNKLRQSVKRRVANNGKAFEKFSFNALRKVGKDSNTTDARPVVKNEPPELEEIINRIESRTHESDYHSSTKGIVASGTIATTSDCETINPSQHDETLNSINLDANSSIVTESPAVDNLNLNCLIDDMLLDGYQNATQNLNDDWLESFFNENT